MDKEKEAFQEVLPEIINSLIRGPTLAQMPHVGSWIKNLLEYTVTGGKLGRGLIASIGYRMLEEPENYSEETQHLARVLGWCIEILQASFLMMDDLIDSASIRRGKPCWYLQPNVGLTAGNDAILLYHSMMELLRIYFENAPFYVNWITQFNEVVFRAAIGEHLDCSSNYSKEKNTFDLFNMAHYNDIATNKTSYYTFKLPIFTTLSLVKNGKYKFTNELNDICMEFGRFLQIQDDYMDAYGDESVTGKTGRDIQEGKCTWVAVTALQRCNEEQLSLFKEFYGSSDPEHVKRIKQLYDDLHLPELYDEFKNTMYDGLVRRIRALPTEEETNFLLEVLNACYKRVN